MLSLGTLMFVIATSSASALTFGVGWSGDPGKNSQEMPLVAKFGASTFRVPFGYRDSSGQLEDWWFKGSALGPVQLGLHRGDRRHPFGFRRLRRQAVRLLPHPPLASCATGGSKAANGARRPGATPGRWGTSPWRCRRGRRSEKSSTSIHKLGHTGGRSMVPLGVSNRWSNLSLEADSRHLSLGRRAIQLRR